MSRGRFFVLDGVDGCGKSTQARRLVASLASGGGDPLHLREPGGTGAGEAVRALLLDPDTVLCAESETLLFAAARAQMLQEKVEPALAAGRDVVCERFHASTFAYQAIAGGLDPQVVMLLLQDWANDPTPDLELILMLDPDEAAARRGADTDRIEARGLEYQQRVAVGYAVYAEGVDRVLVDVGGERERGSLHAGDVGGRGAGVCRLGVGSGGGIRAGGAGSTDKHPRDDNALGTAPSHADDSAPQKSHPEPCMRRRLHLLM